MKDWPKHLVAFLVVAAFALPIACRAAPRDPGVVQAGAYQAVLIEVDGVRCVLASANVGSGAVAISCDWP